MENGVEVVNVRGGVVENGVFIGRPSPFGNPFVIGKDGSRSEVVEKYRAWFLRKVCDPAFRRQVWELEGKNLVCFCSPLACHGDVLKWWLELEGEGEW